MVFYNPISREDRAAFLAEAQRTFGPSCTVEEVTLRYKTPWAVGDRASAAASPFEKKVLQACASAADSASIIRRTQDPILDGSARLPGDMLIGIFAVGMVFDASQASAAADTADLLAISKGMADSVLQCRQGQQRRFELVGRDCLSLGVGVRVDVEGTNETDFGVTDRCLRAIKPTIFGKDQQLTISVYTNRTTDWPQAFDLDVIMTALVARSG